MLDRREAVEWIHEHAAPNGTIELVHKRPWATVLRVPLADGVAWFKACAPVQAFEPRLTAELFGRWPDRVAEVLAYDEARAWLLLADAGEPVGEMGNPPEAWLAALPRYAELQRGEACHASEQLAYGVPDLRVATLPEHYDELLQLHLPLEREEVNRLQSSRRRFAELCEELAAFGVPETIQHDDLHHANLYNRSGRLRVLDWGDASISHPFASLVVTFRFLEERGGIPPDDAWFSKLRDAYLEPWGRQLGAAFDLALRVGSAARAIAYLRQRAAMPPMERAQFDDDFSVVLRRALAEIQQAV